MQEVRKRQYYLTHDQDRMAAGSQATYRGVDTLCESAPNKVRTLMECLNGSDPCRSARREHTPACRIYVN